MSAPNVVAGMQINIIGDATPFAKSMDQAAAIAKRQAKEIKDALNKEIQDSNRTLAIFGEGFGIVLPRQLRTFVSELPGVSKAMSAAFNTVAVFALVDVLVRAAERGKELIAYFEKAGKAAGEAAQATGRILESLRESSDEVEVQKDHLQKVIDKLEKKPHNGIKDALDEAIVEADKLLDKVTQTAEKLSQELRKGAVSSTWGFITGQGADKGIAVGYENHERRFQEILAQYRNQLAEAKQGGADEKTLNGIKQQARTAIDAEFNKYRLEYQDGDHNVIGYTNYNEAKRLQGIYNKNVARGDIEPGYNYSDTLQRLGTIHVANQYERNEALGEFDLSKLQARADRDQAQHQTDKDAKADDDGQRHYIETILLGLPDAIARLARLDKGFSFPIRKGNMDWYYGEMNPETHQREGGFLAQHKMEADKENDAALQKDVDDAKRTDDEHNEAQKRLTEVYARQVSEQEKFIEATSKNRLQFISFQEKIGKLSPGQAAQQISQEHLDQFNKMASLLEAAVAHISSETHGPMDTDHEAEWNADHKRRLGTAVDQLTSLYSNSGFQNMEDEYNRSMQGAMGGVKKFWEEFQKDADATGEHIHSILSGFMGGINSDMADAMMGKKVNWSKTFESAGHSMIESGLKKGESLLFGKVQRVFVENMPVGGFGGPSFASSPVGHFLSKIPGFRWLTGGGSSGISDSTLGQTSMVGPQPGDVNYTPVAMASLKDAFSFLPGFASGGDPDPYKASIVGEKGPELFVPHGVSGTVIPNNKLGGGKQPGGDTYNIDATGTNAAEVNMRVKAGMQIAYQQAVQNSQQSMREHNRRVPSSRRS